MTWQNVIYVKHGIMDITRIFLLLFDVPWMCSACSSMPAKT